MDNYFSIGTRVRELRQANHMSQEQLAFASDITTAYLGQIKRNEKNPTFSNETFPEKRLDPVTTQILYQLRNQDEEAKIIILQMIKQALKLRK